MTDPLQPHLAAASDKFNVQFETARNTESHEKFRQDAFDQRQDEIKVADGALEREQVSRVIGANRTAQPQSDAESKAKKRERFDRMMALLDDTRRQLEELDRALAQRLEALREKYGDDVIGGMVDTYLSDDEKSGLRTEKDKMNALAKKFLDKDGNVKDQYKDLEEAKYVRDWIKAEKLRPVVQKYEGRDYLTPEEEAEILQASEGSSLADNTNLISSTGNQQIKSAVDNVIDHSGESLNVTKASNTLTFS